MAFAILFFLLILVFSVLRIYTRHGEMHTVPDLSGMTLNEAKEHLKERKLIAYVFDSVYSDEFARGTIVEQHPRHGFKVKQNRKIFLTMNAMNPGKVAMPDLVQLTIRQAEARLQTYGLKLGMISYEPDISINLVLQQKFKNRAINPGDTVIKGSVIDLVLGKGLSNEYSYAPDLTGLTLNEATLRAAESYLRIGGIVYDPEITDEEKETARVYRQKPEHNNGGQMPLGSSVDIWLTNNLEKIPSVEIDSVDSYAPQDSIY
ncbi:MAG: PASTA domain-containing protein [Bacteroidales bacterium]|nr:PASTA domain-containing protein [Bacteroidales bacterium]